jgi:release factor glutamine methyltransferase
MVSINCALRDAVDSLNGKASTPLLDAQVLLAHVLHTDKLYLIVNKDRILTEKEHDEYNKLVKKRLEGVPVQYLVKNQEFMGLDFYVEEGVLIPRPDTEILIEKVLDNIDKGKKYNIVDIGTGSGAITVSLAKLIPNSFVYSIDICRKALEIGRKNAKKHGVLDKIHFLHGSIFKPLDEINLKGKVDILVSNPPYIPTKDIENLQIEVSKYEPKTALDGGEDGLRFYREIIDKAPEYLKNEGFIALEIGYDQAEKVVDLMKEKKCYNGIEVTKDLAGIDRVISGKLIG